MRTPLPQRTGDETFDHVPVGARDHAAATVLRLRGMEGRSDAQVTIADRLTEWAAG